MRRGARLGQPGRADGIKKERRLRESSQDVVNSFQTGAGARTEHFEIALRAAS
jgi:hypothetical protein